MDEVKELKKQLSELIKRVGPKAVCVALHAEGLSPRQSEVISVGDHKGKFLRRTVAAVRAVLAKYDLTRAS